MTTLTIIIAAIAFAEPNAVQIEDDFWMPRYERWNKRTIPDVFNKYENRSLAVRNFDLAATNATQGFSGLYFYDGNLLEAIRGASDYLRRYPSKELEARLDGIIDRVVAAQRADGYLHTGVSIRFPQRRWGANGGVALSYHEIYNAGCLIEAGVHHYRATKKTKLLGAAIRFANLMCDTFGAPPKLNRIPTHSLAEAALLELTELVRNDPKAAASAGSGKARPDDYVKLVGFWLDNHGNNCGAPDFDALGVPKACETIAAMTQGTHPPEWRPCWGDYQMDKKPLKDYHSIEGHAVRAMLLCEGIAAYAGATGSKSYGELGARFWRSMAGTKLYITGGVGSDPNPKLYLENFGPAYSLPPNAYLETCAAVGNAFFSAKMAELTGEGMYMDMIERVMYNAMLTAVGRDGCHFTYQNPLNTEKGERWEWHGVPCCPPMFLKLSGKLPEYAYGRGNDGYYVNLFIGGKAKLGKIEFAMTTRYPEAGEIAIVVSPEKTRKFPIRVRIPGWARGEENPFGLYSSDLPKRGWKLFVNGQSCEAQLEKGYAVIERTWKRGDAIRLVLDMRPRKITADSRVKELVGLYAEARGPLVYAEENGKLIPYYDVANNGPAAHQVWRKK